VAHTYTLAIWEADIRGLQVPWQRVPETSSLGTVVTPVILTITEAKIGIIVVLGQPGQKNFPYPSQGKKLGAVTCTQHGSKLKIGRWWARLA
jgi:hypothetical protein